MLDTQNSIANLAITSPAAQGGAAPGVAIPPHRPTLLRRVTKLGLLVGTASAAVGAIEGAFIGYLLTNRQDGGTLILAVSFDRCLLLGLAGAFLGGIVGACDWYAGYRKRRAVSSQSLPVT